VVRRDILHVTAEEEVLLQGDAVLLDTEVEEEEVSVAVVLEADLEVAAPESQENIPVLAANPLEEEVLPPKKRATANPRVAADLAVAALVAVPVQSEDEARAPQVLKKLTTVMVLPSIVKPHEMLNPKNLQLPLNQLETPPFVVSKL